jgi:hypothetical protein
MVGVFDVSLPFPDNRGRGVEELNQGDGFHRFLVVAVAGKKSQGMPKRFWAIALTPE